ncbi:MAG: hypothetical protein Q8N18_18895 [Opitutaceae bacterium]|nr:hypothetical protein [Opitutaceae bacterium]
MPNPFTTRATEFVKSNEAFLTLVTPDPLTFFLEPYARDDGLYTRLVSIQGQPGSGKTTIARLFEFSTLATLLRGGDNAYSELVNPLNKCGAINDGRVQVLGCRLPLESDYRELSQLPYSDKIRAELLQRLIQARAVLAWFNQLRKAEINPEDVTLEVREQANAAVSFVGGTTGRAILDRAKNIEAGIYRIVGALVPPSELEIEREITAPYRLFDIIDRFRIAAAPATAALSAEVLRPLVILDDAHFLAPTQLVQLKNWLIRRELTIGRWILSRLDVLQPKELFDSLAGAEPDVNMPGITAGRDIIRINLQSASRLDGRKTFRSMAKEMSRKYLSQMRIFGQNNITTLESMLPEKVEPLSPSNCDRLRESVRTIAGRFRISDRRLLDLEKMAGDFLTDRNEDAPDLRWAMVRILIHRYAKRVPVADMFSEEDAEPSRPLNADLGVYDGARIQLLHDYDRPYYVGLDALSDAASENAETFLRLASHLVEASENLLIKQRPGALQAKEQHRLLVDRANAVVETWTFPEHRRVRALAEWIAQKCQAKTQELNAPLDHGANAFGIPQAEFDRIGTEHSYLANILKFAVAYNAITLVPNYDCKKRVWCLMELGGVFIVRSGLPFKRGGFVEGSVKDIEKLLGVKQ